ncbi:MAG: DUF1801 domain-containing protein [Asticcacaulis sp.]|nr:DUF1801 domain-containing protein [Asticcacaulis sp.]
MAPAYKTVDNYIAALSEAVQAIVQDLRATILDAAPGVTETIRYNMPAFMIDGTHLIYLAAWKTHIGLYPVAEGDAAFEAALEPYRAEKSTVRFRYDNPIPHDLVRQIVAARLQVLHAA